MSDFERHTWDRERDARAPFRSGRHTEAPDVGSASLSMDDLYEFSKLDAGRGAMNDPCRESRERFERETSNHLHQAIRLGFHTRPRVAPWARCLAVAVAVAPHVARFAPNVAATFTRAWKGDRA